MNLILKAMLVCIVGYFASGCGEQGPQGEQGLKGDKGDQGEPGFSGLTTYCDLNVGGPVIPDNDYDWFNINENGCSFKKKLDSTILKLSYFETIFIKGVQDDPNNPKACLFRVLVDNKPLQYSNPPYQTVDRVVRYIDTSTNPARRSEPLFVSFVYPEVKAGDHVFVIQVKREQGAPACSFGSTDVIPSDGFGYSMVEELTAQ